MNYLRLMGGALLPFAIALTLSGCGGNGTGNAGPAVTRVTPTANTTGISTLTPITVTFNRKMNWNSLTPSTFSASTASGPLTGVITYSGLTASLQLTGAIPVNTTVNLTLTTGAMDAYNMPLAQQYNWAFTTGTSSQVPAPSSFVRAAATEAV